MKNFRDRIVAVGIGLLIGFSGIVLAATFTKFSPATGILKGSASTYVTTAASSADLLGVIGTVPVANGGTNLTSATDDNTMVGNGTTWESKAIPNCGSSTQALAYSTSTNTFSCQTVSGSGASLTTGTWTSSLSVGCTVAQNQVWTYSQIGSGTGSIVTIASNSTPACTSNSGAFSTASGSVTAAVRPSRQIFFSGLAGTDNGSNVPICLSLLADGTLSYFRQGTDGQCGSTTFTTSGVKGANLGTSNAGNVNFTYRIE